MTKQKWSTVDGNEAAASVAYRTNEVIAIYPITPASPMGELSDAWSSQQRKNVWHHTPQVVEMQSEGGAAGAVHGALQAGALTTTFTASQGLLLMIPNMYKIAGELTACCVHVAARTLATHALSIFGDHSDVMACRQTGFALLASGSVQESHDFACIAQAATLRSRIPFLHFFDGFRTSHEINKIQILSDEDLLAMLDGQAIRQHRERALTPDHPVLRGTAQNPDTFFQAREACNLYYDQCPSIVEEEMRRFGERTGRQYRLFDYVGHPEAERVVVIMGSGAEVAHETIEPLVGEGDKVGVLKVRLYRPFQQEAFLRALPPSVRKIAVLDRTKEPGAIGDPLYLDVVASFFEAAQHGPLKGRATPIIVGGRYGLSSKEFTPTMVRAILEELRRDNPSNHFTVGINDDVTQASLALPREVPRHPVAGMTSAMFYGLGSDGTVGANKNSIKILGNKTKHFVQAYFVYDSKKAGAMTVSHLRTSPEIIRSSYLIECADFVACHQFAFLERFDVLDKVRPGGTLLLNAPHGVDTLWDHLPREVQETILEKKLRVFAIDANSVAQENGMGRRINTIMQVCFFSITELLDLDVAIEEVREAIRRTYRRKGEVIVHNNLAAIDGALEHLHELRVPATVTSRLERRPPVSESAPDFVKRVTALMLSGHGDLLPVSAFPADGTWPTGTAKWEKRAIAAELPQWDESICIQCNKCAMVCPHAAIRAKVYDDEYVSQAPRGFKSTTFRAHGGGQQLTIQVAPDDCTGCTLCVEVCPAKDKANPSRRALEMVPFASIRDREASSFDFFLGLPEIDREGLKIDVKNAQLMQPLFEFSGACSGCGETPYIKLLTQLFGDRLLIANATGCSSIYGGNLPTTPYSTNADGRGPAWSNSLFEDNAEFGFGFRLAVDSHREQAEQLLRGMASGLGEDLVAELLHEEQEDEAGIARQRRRVETLQQRLAADGSPTAQWLGLLADYLVKKSVWLVGGDGWAYDIGYGGLDHVLGQNRNVNILVLDTEVYSNTGGQASKATPIAAVAKFASAGKSTAKKDLGREAMSYGSAYVAQVAFGAKDTQTVRAFQEADAFPGPSLIIAYSPCIAHGYDLSKGLGQQGLAVGSGAWPLYRYDPRRVAQEKPPLVLDSKPPNVPLKHYMRNEARFRMAEHGDPERFRELLRQAQEHASQRYAVYEQLAGIRVPILKEEAKEPEEKS